MGFKILSTVMASIAFVLFGCLLIVPEPIFILFQIPNDESAFFIARRAAMLFVGIAILSWLGRHAGHSLLRQAVCIGLGVSMLGLAILGTIEYLRGYASMGIGLAVLAEIVLGVSYLRVWFVNRESAEKLS